MVTTDISHVKDGISVSWAHTCGHLSLPLFYASMEYVERDRPRMEGQPCWECRNRMLLGLSTRPEERR